MTDGEWTAIFSAGSFGFIIVVRADQHHSVSDTIITLLTMSTAAAAADPEGAAAGGAALATPVAKDDDYCGTCLPTAVTEKLQAGAFASLCRHLQERSDAVSNMDLMTVSGFCRNCLAKVRRNLDLRVFIG